MIQARDATLIYMDHGKAIRACDNVSITIDDHEFVGILGPSGSGKSSLLYLLCGIKNPTSGEVLYDGRPYASLSEVERSNARLKEFGFVFQQPYLIGYLSAIENVAIANPSAPLEKLEELVTSLGIGAKMHRRPSELSGGERQRVCIARALSTEPRVVFADEPTASLDHAAGEQVVELLVSHRKGALVMVTHDRSMLKNADRILMIDEGSVHEVSEAERAHLFESP